VAEVFISATAAGGDTPTVVILVAIIPSEKPTVWPSKDIAGQQKAGRPTGKPKEDDGCKFLKKPWLMHLQHLYRDMIGYFKITRLPFLVVISAVEKV
jgi:hypothetical protein